MYILSRSRNGRHLSFISFYLGRVAPAIKTNCQYRLALLPVAAMHNFSICRVDGRDREKAIHTAQNEKVNWINAKCGFFFLAQTKGRRERERERKRKSKVKVSRIYLLFKTRMGDEKKTIIVSSTFRRKHLLQRETVKGSVAEG